LPILPIDAFRATLDKAVRVFHQHSIRFHLTGGIASVYYGEPRMAQDLELPLTSCADVGASELVRINKGSHKSRRDLRQLFRCASDADRLSIEQLAEQLEPISLLAEVLGESDEIT